MSRNIEIKARLRDYEKVYRRALEMAASKAETTRQRDTYFLFPQGRLKLRATSSEAELIYYERSDTSSPKLSRYARLALSSPEIAERELSGVFKVKCVVDKRRTVLIVRETRIHFDQVKGLGDFIELEVVLHGDQDEKFGIRRAQRLMKTLGINRSDLIVGSYADMLEKKVIHNRDGGPANARAGRASMNPTSTRKVAEKRKRRSSPK